MIYLRVHSWWPTGLGETGRNWRLGLAFAFSCGMCLCISQTFSTVTEYHFADRPHLAEERFIWLTVSEVLFQDGGEIVV